MKHPYYLAGETIEGEMIDDFFGGTYDECVNRAEEILNDLGGGHIDIFILHDDCDEFVGDVEV